jgi:hypothetical protein
MLMQEAKTYVRVDEHEVLRVGNSDVMLDSIIASFQQGASAETIQQQYPALSLEEVYGAIAWCLANAEEVAKYLERQAAVWDRERAKAVTRPSPVLQRLRALRDQRGVAAS